jgi:hypothetical protein
MNALVRSLFNRKTKRLELQLSRDARVEDLVSLFNAITDVFKPSMVTLEMIFNILFLEKSGISQKAVEIARILVDHNIEVHLKMLDTAERVSCEIQSHKKACRYRLVRVLHYLSDGAPGLTRVIVV